MPIEFRCPICDQNLRVAEEHQGQQAKCPQCGNLTTVPAPSSTALGPAFAPFPSTATGLSGEQVGMADEWMLKTRTGDTFGPVKRAELDHWLADGRIDAGSQVQQAGWKLWKPAAEVYPSLAGAGSFGAVSTGPYTYVKPHRGAMVLILGVLSITFCPLTGIAAWMMGSADLREMREGRMDKSGEGSTQAGYVCGIIGTILFLLQVVVVVLYILFIVVFVVAAAK